MTAAKRLHHVRAGERIKFTGERGKLAYTVTVTTSERTKGECRCCHGKVLRSWRTGVLHAYCYGCRLLRMIYGPSIAVTRAA